MARKIHIKGMWLCRACGVASDIHNWEETPIYAPFFECPHCGSIVNVTRANEKAEFDKTEKSKPGRPKKEE